MGLRWKQEPPYPTSFVETDRCCSAFVTELARVLEERLVCVLLCGSWARGEPRPPESDIDLFVIVDAVDADMVGRLRDIWRSRHMCPANIVGADEIAAMPRDAAEMFTTNARVLYGRNPFLVPTKRELAADLGRAAEGLARSARILLLYPWLTDDERLQGTRALTNKWGLPWAIKCLVAMRTGTFPRT